MFSLLKLFTVLLSFSSSFTCIAKVSDWTKCLSLNDELCMVRPNFIDLNPIELKYYPFMISLGKCNGSCKVLSPKTCIPKKKTTTKKQKTYMLSI